MATTATNKYGYGYRDVYVAQLTTEGTSSTPPTYGAPAKLMGNVKLKLSDKTSSTDSYADDVLYASTGGATSFEGNADFYGDLAADVEAWMLGHTVDANGNPGRTEDGIRKPFGMWFTCQGEASDGTPDPYKVMLYHVKTTSDPDMAPETKQDKTSPATISTPIKATPTTINGVDWSYSKIYKRVDPTSYAAMDTAAYLPVKTVAKAGA